MTKEQIKRQDDNRVMCLAKMQDGSHYEVRNKFPYRSQKITAEEFSRLLAENQDRMEQNLITDGNIVNFWEEKIK